MQSRSIERQSGRPKSKVRANLAALRTAYAGLRAGVGYSAVVIATTRGGSLRPTISRANSNQLVDPVPEPQLHQPALLGADQYRRGLRERAGPIGHAKLIGDDSQFVALGRQSPDRHQKVSTAQPVDPARAQRDARTIHRGNRVLPVQLALAIHVERAGPSVFDVRSRRDAVEHVIGRIVNQHGAEPLGFLGENRRRARIDGLCALRLPLRLIDRGVRRRVDDQLRPDRADLVADRVGIGEIELISVESGDLSVGREEPRQFVADLPARAENQESHAEYAGRFSRGISSRNGVF